MLFLKVVIYGSNALLLNQTLSIVGIFIAIQFQVSTQF